MTNPVKCKLRLFIIKLRNDSFSSELHNALSSVHPYKATKVDPCRLGRQRYKTLRFSPAFQLSTERGAGITKGKRAIRRHFVKCACASLFVPPARSCALRLSLFLFWSVPVWQSYQESVFETIFDENWRFLWVFGNKINLAPNWTTRKISSKKALWDVE